MIVAQTRRAMIAVGKESWLLFVSLSAVNASNYLFHVVISRLLGPRAYGALGSLLAILLILSVPLSAVQATMAKRLAEMGSDDDRTMAVWVDVARSIVKPAAWTTAFLALASPLLQTFLHLGSEVAALVLAAYMVPAALGAVLRGALQGRLRFRALAVTTLLLVIVRVVVGVVLVRAGAGLPGAVAATVIAEAAGAATAMWFLVRGESLPRRNTPEANWFLPEVRPVAAGMLAMWVLIEIDLLLARHFLAPGTAGSYAAAGLLARAVLFIPGAVGLVALPHFAEHRGRGTEAYGWLLQSAAFVLVLGLGASAIFTGASHTVVELTFGDRFASAAALLPVLSLAMLALGLVNLFVFFHVAAGSRAFHLLWIAVGGEVAGIAAFHGSGMTIALVLLIVAVTAAGVGFLTCRSVALSPAPLGKLPRDLSLVHQPIGLADLGVPELSLVIPCHNGGASVGANVCSTRNVLQSLGRPYEIIVVSDGSTDGSERAIVETGIPVTVVRYAHRQGKGMALRVGMTRARGRYVAFMDSDGDLDAAELRSFLAVMELYEPELVIGSKRHPLSTVDYPTTRRIMSWVYQRIVRLLFGLNVRDTQTGMKLIRRDVLDQVLPRMLEKRFAFDLEFLVVARRLGFRRVFEAPIRLHHEFSSTVNPRAAFRILLDTAAIFYRDRILRSYDRPPVETVLPEWEESLLSTALVPALDRGAS